MRVRVHVVFFFSAARSGESPWLPGSPGTDDSFIHSLCVWKICGCVGVDVFKGIVLYHVTVDPGWLVVFFGLVRAAAARIV